MSEIGRTGAPVLPPAGPAASTPATPPAQPASPETAATPAGADAASRILEKPPQSGGRDSAAAAQPAPGRSAPQDAVRTSEIAEAARSGRAIEAQVAARDGNAVVLRSQAGTTFVLTGNPKLVDYLTQGSAVRLAVQSSAPVTVAVLAASGITLSPPLSALLQSPTPTQMALAVPQVQAITATLPQPGQTLAARVLPDTATPGQPGTAATPATGPAPLPAGAQAQVVVRNVALPGTAPPPVTENSPLPGAVAAAAAKAAPPPPPAIPGASAGNTPAQQLTAVVIGQNQAGQTLLRTPQGLLGVDFGQALPPGTQVTLEVTALLRPASPAVTQLGPAPLAGVLQRLQGGWPLLQQTIDAVRGLNPELAARMTQALPQPNARLAASALQFMAAAAMGSAQAWIGAEAAKVLKDAGRGDLLQKLDDDFRDLAKLNQRGADQDWQALTMPMLVQGKVEAVQIFMRRRRDARKKQQQTRFIIDFSLESSGLVQFDGFFSEKRLDLILRVEHEFGPAFKNDVRQIFDDAMAITGMTGSLAFHEREAPIPWPSAELSTPGPSQQVMV